MESTFADIDEDVIIIRLTEPQTLNFQLTKNFTLGTLKEIISSSIPTISLGDMILEILGEAGKTTISGIESDHLTLGQLNMQDNVEIRVSQINRYRGGFDRRNLRPGMIDIGEFDKNHA